MRLRPSLRSLAAWLLVAPSLACAPAEPGDAPATRITAALEDDGEPLPGRLAIYYGWPSLVEGAGGDVETATAAFAPFDVVVLGDGLEHPEHGDHASTLPIVGALAAQGVEVYGYVDMGVSTQGLSEAAAKQHADEWAAMGVAGVFWDDAGYDYGVDRARQTALIGYTHGLGLKAFVNAWQPDDVFADDAGGPSPLVAGDIYLAERHPVAAGAPADLDAWWSKSLALKAYRAASGVRIAAVATGDEGDTGWASSDAYRQSLWAAALFGWELFGFGNAEYSASGAGANRLRVPPPVATDAGSAFAGPPIRHDATRYTRDTDAGTIVVTSDGRGTFRGGPCDTTALGDADVIWPLCATTPPPHSSPFGPRQRASSGDRYDWHRGVDLPTPMGSPVYAPMDGVIRIAGAHEAYSDLLVQIRHRAAAPYLYTNAMHLSAVAVAAGDLVSAGDLVGFSGASESGFEHVHFETREGCLYQDCNRNPWGYLPIGEDAPPPLPSLAGAGADGTMLVLDIEAAPGQLDFDGIGVAWGGENAVTAAFDALNATTDRDFPEGMDHPVLDLGGGAEVALFPAAFNTSSPAAGYRFVFAGLPVAETGTAWGLDLGGAGEAVPIAPELPPARLSLPRQRAVVGAGGAVAFSHVVQNTGDTPLELSVSATSAQSRPVAITPSALFLEPGAARTIRAEWDLEATSPVPVGDALLVEVSSPAHPHAAVALDTVETREAPPAPCPPAVSITSVPALGSTDELAGTAACVDPTDYRVAVYIHTWGWWTKPTFDAPLTTIAPDGSWVADVTTDPGDESATRFEVFLIPAGYDPPRHEGEQALSAELGDTAVASDSAIRDAGGRTLEFAGRTWKVKRTWGEVVGPGPNHFSDDPADVRVDAAGKLHLRVVARDGLWWATEVVSAGALGYGTYTWAVEGAVDALDPGVVLGLFTWDSAAPEHHYREIDVELSRWGDPAADNGQFVVQPWDTAGNMARFDASPGGAATSYRFDWGPESVSFGAFDGPDPDQAAPFATWTYEGADVPPEGEGNARMNLWLIHGAPPANGESAEVIIADFRYEAPAPPAVVETPPSGDLARFGTVVGSYEDLAASGDGQVEQLEERESGGKPSRRHSALDHAWTFGLPAATGAVTLLAEAWASPSTDGDRFVLAWSRDGVTWRDLLTVDATALTSYAAALPPGTSGVLWIAARDTDRTAGNRALDSLFVDRLVIRSEDASGEPPDTTTTEDPTPAVIALSARYLKFKRQRQVLLEWSGSPDPVDIARDGATIATGQPGAGQYADTEVEHSASYTYRICRQSAPTSCSNEAPVSY